MTQSSFFAPFKRVPILAGCASLALLAACDDGAGGDGENSISIVGSSTVYPFAQKVAEDYAASVEGAVMPSVEQTGTSEGIDAFCKGEGTDTPDIVNASRRMTLREFNGCNSRGVGDIIEIKVGRDGIAFVSSLDEGIDLKLTPEIVYKALSAKPYGKDQTNENWSDVEGGLEEAPIIVYGPPTTSGTRDALLDIIMMPACKADPAMASLETRDPQEFMKDCHSLRSSPAYLDQGEEDDLIARKVANNPRAVGIFGYSYLDENRDKLKGLSLGGIEPTAETIADGSYPASRPLYIYVKKANIGKTPGIEEYLAQWAKSWDAGGPLAKIGLVPATDEDRAASAAAIKDLTPMTNAGLE